MSADQASLFDVGEPASRPARLTPQKPAPPSTRTALTTPKPPASQPQPGLFDEPKPKTVVERYHAPRSEEHYRPRARFRWGTARGHAAAIAEACAEAWWASHAGGHLEIPFGSLAAALLLRIADRRGPDPAIRLASLDARGTRELLEEIWSRFWLMRPDLAEFARPIHSWVTGDREPRESDLRGARAVLITAVEYGVLEFTEGLERPESVCEAFDADMLGHLVQVMRSAADKDARGEYYTPPEVCDLLAEVILTSRGEEPCEGQSICDPAAGTGGMIRAVAQHLRTNGIDPAGMRWYINDIDPLASGLSAVNAFVWGLGWNVFVGCADTLADAEWPQRAEQRRSAVLRHHRDTIEKARIVAAMHRAFSLLDGISAQPTDTGD